MDPGSGVLEAVLLTSNSVFLGTFHIVVVARKTGYSCRWNYQVQMTVVHLKI